MKKGFYFIYFSLLFMCLSSQAQYVTGAAPVQDGTVNAGEYYGGNSGAWSMCWDDNFLYLALTGGQASEPGIVYFDFNANSIANGGAAVGSNGSTTGKNDYGSTPNLPFVSNARIFFATNLNGSGNYAEVNYNTGSGWGSPTNITAVLGTSSGTTRELKISWAQLRNGVSARPVSFNWLGTATSTGGFIYNQFPTINYFGNGSTNPGYYFYQTVDSTNAVNASNTSNAFDANLTSFSNYNTSFDYTNVMPSNLFNISLGKSGSSGTLNLRNDITVRGGVAVYNGTLKVNSGSGKTMNMSGTNQLIKVFGNSGGSITGTDVGIGNDITLSVRSGTTTLDGDATANFDNEKKFFNVNVDAGATLALSRGILVRYGSFNVSGTLQINANGYVQRFIPSNVAASYNGASATLVYNNGGTYNTTDFEWPSTNAPANVTVQNANTDVVLGNSKTISGTLTLTNGKITTGVHVVEVLAGGNVARTNGWVNGTMKRGYSTGSNISMSFDIGDASNWTPANVTLGNAAVAGNIQLSTVAAQHPNYATSGLSQTKFVNRNWNADFRLGKFTNGQIQFNYLNTDLQGGASENNIKILQFDGTSWINANKTTGTSAYFVTIGNLSVAGILTNQSFAAGECVNDIVLPIASANTPVCVGKSLILTGNVVTSGGVAPFTYNWSGPNGYSGNQLVSTLSNVTSNSAGNYSIVATDAIGCSSASQSVAVSLRLPSSSTTTLTICPGQLPFTWNGLTFSSAGTRTAILSNAVGCDSAATLNLFVRSSALKVSFTKTNAGCFNSAVGSITVTASGGTPPYSYRLGSNGAFGSSNQFLNLKAGQYTVSVQDATGCGGFTGTITISQSAALSASIAKTDVSCFGKSDATLTVTPNNGTAPYQYKLASGSTAFQSSNVFTNLRPGFNGVTVQDAGGCTTSINFTINSPLPLGATSTKTDETCPLAKDGSIIANGTGGTAPYQYRLGTSGAYTSSNTFNNLKAGSYRIFVKDFNNCLPISIPVVLVVTTDPCPPPNPVAFLAKNNEVSKSFEVSMSPNPSNNTFRLITKNASVQPLFVNVFDANGRKVYEAKSRYGQLLTFGENLKSGLYLIEVRQGAEVKTIKAIKE